MSNTYHGQECYEPSGHFISFGEWLPYILCKLLRRAGFLYFEQSCGLCHQLKKRVVHDDFLDICNVR